MRKILYVYGGPEFHPTEPGGRVLQGLLAADGRYALEMTADLMPWPGCQQASMQG